MSTAGNIVFCFIMMSVSLVLIVESIREMASHPTEEDTTEFHVPSIVAVATAFFVKFCLFLYCWGLRQYSQVMERTSGIDVGAHIMAGS
jgi:protein-S-isoprenylcysteine O-methyltransferase Ste14